MSRGASNTRRPAQAFDFSKKTAIVAGGGDIPVILANFIAQNGTNPLIFAINGEASPSLEKFKHRHVSTADIGGLITALRRDGIDQLVMVGSVSGRPSWRDFRLNSTTIKLAFSIISGLKSGDNVLLTNVLNAIEAEGVSVFGVHEIMPDLLMPNGPITKTKPTAKQRASINLGMQAAKMLGELDAGQGCIVIGNRIVALEGVEGTSAMLDRVASLRRNGRLNDKKGGVLVKMCKPQQERRVDLPTIGLATVDAAVSAKLSGIAVHADSALIVNSAAVIEAADAHGLFVYGVGDEH